MTDGVKVFQPAPPEDRPPQMTEGMRRFLLLLVCLLVVGVYYVIVGVPTAIHRMSAPWSGFGTGPDRLAGTWVGRVNTQTQADFAKFSREGGQGVPPLPPPMAGTMMIKLSFGLDIASLSLEGKVSRCGPGQATVIYPFKSLTVDDPRQIGLQVHIGKGPMDYDDYDLRFAPGSLRVQVEPRQQTTTEGTLHKGSAAEFEQLCSTMQ